MAQAADLLAAEEAERHRRVVLVVDEAHLLDPAQLEELRLLTNAEMDSASPFAGILVGQPTLNRQLRMGIFAALDQRIATRFAIKAMDIGESARPTCATTWPSPDARSRSSPTTPSPGCTGCSNGLPRALNNAATAALIAAAADGKDLVDDACAKKAVAELTAGLIVLSEQRREDRRASARPAEPCARSAAGSCADSVAANTWADRDRLPGRW